MGGGDEVGVEVDGVGVAGAGNVDGVGEGVLLLPLPLALTDDVAPGVTLAVGMTIWITGRAAVGVLDGAQLVSSSAASANTTRNAP